VFRRMTHLIVAIVIMASAVMNVHPAVHAFAQDCRADKVATITEDAAGNPQRIEAGGGGFQHVDYYPLRGVKAVSYILPPTEPNIWWGFGSIWEWPSYCVSFNYVGDAAGYAQGRLNNGHSGLVIDLRSGYPVVVANVNGMEQWEIDLIISQDQAGQSGIAVAAAPVAPVTTYVQPAPVVVAQPAPVVPQQTYVQAPQPVVAVAPPVAQGGCDPAIREDRDPVVGVPWNIPPDGWRILSGWSNWPGLSQQEYKILIPAGAGLVWPGGGSLWSRPVHCEAATRADFATNRHPEMTVDVAANFATGYQQPYTAAPNTYSTSPYSGYNYSAGQTNYGGYPYHTWQPEYQTGVPTFSGPVAPAQGCPPATESTFTSNTTLKIDGPAIIHPWWNSRPTWFGQNQVRVIVRPGEFITLLDFQGKLWRYANLPSCAATLDREYGNAPQFAPVSLYDLRARGLAQ